MRDIYKQSNSNLGVIENKILVFGHMDIRKRNGGTSPWKIKINHT